MNERFKQIKESVESIYRPEFDLKLKVLLSLPDCSRKKTASISSAIVWGMGDYCYAIKILTNAIKEIKEGLEK